MKIVSWNVNGIRAILKKNFREWLAECDADIVCLQETKARPDQLDPEDVTPEGWKATWNPSQKKQGYSGTACFYREEPLSITTGLPDEQYKGEGRVICLEYDTFYLLNIYFPNGQMSDERLDFKMGFYDAFLEYSEELRKKKPVITCGDYNTAHTEIDLKNPKSNEERSGFLPIERAWIDMYIAAGYVDTFRMFEEGPGHYSWWSYRFKARERNAGWRIDYFFAPEELREKVRNAWIESDVMGSDHCPIGLEIDF